MEQNAKPQGIPGWKVVVFIFLPLTAIVGSAFLVLAPIVTAKEPGKLYVGIRFNNESTVRFMSYNDGNPEVSVSILPADAAPTSEAVKTFFPARRGKNIFDVTDVPDGAYTVRFETFGFEPIAVPMMMKDGSLTPPPGAAEPDHALVMDKFIGVELQEIAAAPAPDSAVSAAPE